MLFKKHEQMKNMSNSVKDTVVLTCIGARVLRRKSTCGSFWGSVRTLWSEERIL